MSKTFPSKLLLFGEYALIKGGQGLAFPFNYFFGQLDFGKDNHELMEFCDYLEHSPIISQYLSVEKFRTDLGDGIYFKSNIPRGHGLGSSGALCAAIYDRYKKREDLDIHQLRDVFALMESFYHGASSGVDPLISFLKTPLLIKEKNNISILTQKLNANAICYIYLLNTQIERKTAPLVNRFLEMIKKEKNKKLLKDLLYLNDECIHAYLNSDKDAFWESILKLSELEYNFLIDMVPSNLDKQWFDSLESKDVAIKLCGAGGGGFYLVFSQKPLLDFAGFSLLPF
jgi:mevalonate kinase